MMSTRSRFYLAATLFLCALGLLWLAQVRKFREPTHLVNSIEADKFPNSKNLPDATSANAQRENSPTNSDSPPQANDSRADDAISSAAQSGQPGHSNSSNPMPLANGGDAPLEVSTRAKAAQGKTVADILNDADLSDPDVRARKVAELKLLDESQQQAVTDKARQLGIPLRIDGPDHKVSTLYDFRGDEPVYRITLNRNAAISTGANLLAPAPYSLDGTGLKVGVWDGGPVLGTHQELTGRITRKDVAASIAADDHATHVAGTIGATGVVSNAKGMSPKIKIDSYEWTSDYAEMTAAGAASAGDAASLPLSNHSYGFNAFAADMGRYETEANAVDAVAASLPYYLIFWAAGNEQDTLTAKGGYQSITFNGLGKNIMTIGAADDAVSGGIRSFTPPPAAAFPAIAYFSSLGPCDDGRIKPDIVANGVNVYSPVATGTTAYDGTYSGTSMATPNAMGSAALLVQLYAREFSGLRMRSSMLKALMIETADDIGTAGPDYKFGWGLLNVKAAADLILAHKSSLAAPKMIDGQITNTNKTVTHSFTWDGVSPIRATLCWTEPAGTAQTASDSRTPNLKHNLDAKITAPNGSTIYQPYVMPFVGTWTTASMASAATTGKNNVDNVEQVYLAAPTLAGTYTVTVSLDGTITTSSQAYSLIIKGGSSVESNPPPNIALTSPQSGSSYLPGAPVTLTATATDLTIGSAPGAVTQVEFFNGATSLGVDTTAPYSWVWTPPTADTYSITAKATDNESAVATSTAASITVLSGDGTPVVSSFTPTSGVGGSLVILTGSNFVNVSSVKFNGLDAIFTVDSSGQITATVPALATTGILTVTNNYGTGTSSGTFTVVQAPVLISQIYGAGENSSATYRQDYVELYNRSASPVSLAGWSVQYASSAGTTWAVTSLTGSIAPGKYYLIGLASGTSGAAIPTPDASGTNAMSATNGKVALVNFTTRLSGSSPVGTVGLQDFVGFGTANAYEGVAAPAPSTTTAIFRVGAGATDTGNNSADFAAATPNPRNSGAGPAVTPVITSATTATGTVGTPFTYQITASNIPTSFAATSLPTGLVINTATGAITGTPTVAGTTSVTISATNTGGTGSAVLSITINPSGGGGGAPVALFSENMGSPTATTTIAANLFQNSSLTFSGTGDARDTSPSSAYIGASGSGNIFITNTIGTQFEISGINTTGYSGLALTFGQLKTTSASSNELLVETSSDGSTYAPLTYSRPTGSGTSVWLKIAPTGTIPSTANLRIRFRQSSASPLFRIDDVILSGVPNLVATPVITATGPLAAVSTTYGTASATPSSFNVSGANMTAGILVTPPGGFEVSLTAGSGYASTVTIPGTGTIASTQVFLRLAAATTAGSYSGNVSCSSAGASPVTLPTVSSDVRLKLLTITANNLSKPAGTTLTLGAAQTTFTTSGLVGSETIDSVTLTASGGTETGDPAGTYAITPSAAAGGTFSASNYDLNYTDGILTVTAPTYSNWLTSYSLGGLTALNDDPDSDGNPNGIENIFGTAPNAPTTGLTQVSATATTLVFRHSRSNSPASDLTASYEWSKDLVSWQNSAANHNGTTVTLATAIITDTSAPANDLVEVTATVSGSAASKIFVRLKVSKP